MIKKFLFLAILSTPSLTIAEENITKLGLTSAYQKTMKNSPVIKEAESRLEIAIGKSKQASAWLNPEFEFDIENFSGTGPFKETSIAEYTYTLTQKLEIGGKRSARIDEALKNLKAAQLEYTIAQRNLRKDVAIAYMQAIETEENLKLAEEQAMLAQKVLNTVKNRVQSAREPEIQQRKAEVAYATASLKYKQAVRVNKLTKSKLANLWGDLNLKQNLNTEKFFEIIKPKDYSFYKDQLEESPQLKRYRPLIDAQKSVVNLQKAQNIPDPTFRFGLKKFNENGEQALVAGISFPLPVFNQNGGNIRQALAKVTTIEAQKDQSIILLSQLYY